MIRTPGVRVPAALHNIVTGRSFSPGYVHAVTIVADVVAVALEAVGYKPMMPALLPPLPHDITTGSVPASQCMQITRVFSRWLERGERLPLRYHLLWPMPAGEREKLSVDVGAHCALPSDRDVSVQLRRDVQALAGIAAALRLPFAGAQQLTDTAGDAAVTTAFYLTGPHRVGVPFATWTRGRGEDAAPWVQRLPEPGGPVVYQGSLRIALMMLADVFLDFHPELEAR